MGLSQRTLKKYFTYDHITGGFLRVIRTGKRDKIGDAAVNHSRGYKSLNLLGESYLAHRMAWLYVYGKEPSGHIDHIDHNRSNNAIINLRDIPEEENFKNQSTYKNNKSGYCGIFYEKDRKKYKAYIKHNGKNINLGRFSDIDDAISARKKAETEHGYHSNHGK